MEDRAVACIQAIAVGDAMGKMTEGYWPEEFISNYGGYVQSFHKPFQSGSKFTWRYSEVTDDTAGTLLIAESILKKRMNSAEDM